MTTSLPALTPVEESLYLTLRGRALDSRAERSILADAVAGEVERAVEYDRSRYPLAGTQVFDVALRAKKLDGVVRGFIARHPDAVVLDLGAGLDTRVHRVDPPSTVDWYDVDLPAATAARERLVPPHPAAHNLAADLTDPGWLDAVPTGRPAVAVADGLVAFLAQDDLTALLDRLTGHVPGGELAFNGYTRFHVWALTHYKGTASIAGLVHNPGFDDPHDPERWNPRLRLVEEILLTRAPEVARYPLPIRLVNRLAGLSAAWSRRGTTVLRYRF